MVRETGDRWILSTTIWLAILCAPCLAGEESPASATAAPTELRKPAPNAGARPYRELFQSLIRERYPELLTKPMEGIPVVTVLFNLQGDVVRSDLTISAQPPGGLAASEDSFAGFGVAAGDLQYVAAATIPTPANTVLVVFGGTGSRQLDRRLVERFFPQVLSQGAPLNAGIWILFDHDGHVLRTGEEQFAPGSLRGVLEHRYPGIRTSDLTATPVVGAEGRPLKDPRGRPLQLTCVWLASDSPLPKS
jgi:hypothetical protein